MELPESLLENTIEEQKIYFFTEKALVGIPNHMHVCIKMKDRILLFSTCTSQKAADLRFNMKILP